MSSPQHRAQFITTEAKRLGFQAVGFSKAERLNEEAERLEAWLNRGYQGEMSYLERHFDKRVDPTLLVPGTKSVVTLLYNYYTPIKQLDEAAPKISQYAYSEDYHAVIKRKLKELSQSIRDEIGDVHGRVFVDSAPVLERSWAERAGLGWIGKHSLILNRERGSYAFIAVMMLDIDIEPTTSVKDYCGTCTRCIDACPTDAIVDNKLVDGSKCISYFTIELKDQIPTEVKGQFEGWMFGCDICQDVCPWNRFAQPHQEPAFEPKQKLLDMTRQEWLELSEDMFEELFEGSPVQRTGYEGLKRNIRFLEK